MTAARTEGGLGRVRTMVLACLRERVPPVTIAERSGVAHDAVIRAAKEMRRQGFPMPSFPSGRRGGGRICMVATCDAVLARIGWAGPPPGRRPARSPVAARAPVAATATVETATPAVAADDQQRERAAARRRRMMAHTLATARRLQSHVCPMFLALAKSGVAPPEDAVPSAADGARIVLTPRRIEWISGCGSPAAMCAEARIGGGL